MHHLFVSRAGDSLVNVTQNRNTYRLLANFDGTNVILLQIDAGSVVWLTPDPERPVYLEYYTLLTGELTAHLTEIDRTAGERVNRMVSEMAAAQGVNEALKERDPMAWVGAMNSLKAQAEEIVLNELVYA